MLLNCVINIKNVYLLVKRNTFMESENKSTKYDDLLIAAKDLFWKYGIKRVTIEEICKQAGVSKMTYYRFFKNKVDIAKAILEDIFSSSLAKYEEIVNRKMPFEEKVNNMLLLKHESTQNISFEFVNDIYNRPELGLNKVMEHYMDKSMAITVGFFKKAQHDGEIRKDIKIEFILYYFDFAFNALKDQKLVSKYNEAHDLIMEITKFLFYGVMNRDEKQ